MRSLILHEIQDISGGCDNEIYSDPGPSLGISLGIKLAVLICGFLTGGLIVYGKNYFSNRKSDNTQAALDGLNN